LRKTFFLPVALAINPRVPGVRYQVLASSLKTGD
jgi:hypothetical protein